MALPAAPHVARNVLREEHVHNTYLIDMTRFLGVATFAVVAAEQVGRFWTLHRKPGEHPHHRAAQSVATRPVVPVVAPGPVAKRRGRVMVIDDEVMIGEVLRQVLEKEHAVSVFTNARQALDCLMEGDDFDVILCDLTMPVMTASEFYQALTRLDPRLADKVIFTTAGAFVASNQAFLRTIPNLCLEKPFDLGELRQTVQEFVTGPR